MLEQVGDLSIDLERLGLVERVKIEELTHMRECITNDYETADANRGNRGSLS